jgi:tripartite ATP-independent transporter DctM subunit
MSEILLSVLGILVFLFLSFHSMPVAFSFAAVGTVGLILVRGLEPGLAILGLTPFSWGTNSNLLPLPLFVLMGMFAFYSKISQDLFQTAYKWMGRLPGGIAQATNLASTGFAACCGVSMAGAATMASIAYPEMHKLNYSRRLATGCIVAGGGLSSLIPPSLAFIIYGFLTEESIAKLFMAGLLPGLMLSVMFLLTIFFMCRRNPDLGPPGPIYTWRERLLALKGVLGMLVLFILVFGGLYIGIFTPTEAGAAGACGAFIITAATGRLKPAGLIGALKDTLKTGCFIMTMIIGANIFNSFLGTTGLTAGFSEWVTGLDLPPYVILGGILFVYLPLGMILDIGAVILLTVPIFVPPLEALGFNPIYLGVLIAVVAEIGFMTPPVGLNAFVVHGVTHVPLAQIFRGILPFALVMLIGLIILVVFPQISLFLPGIMD